MEKITNKIAALQNDSQYFSLEFFPPKTQEGFANLLPRIHRLARLRPLFATVTWGAGGSTANGSLELAEYTQQRLGLTTCLHLTCTNTRRDIIDQALDRCRRAGICNILALRGDEPRAGEYDLSHANGNGDSPSLVPEAASEPSFIWAEDLVRYIRSKHGGHFCIGVAAYPEGHATTQHDPSQSLQNDIPHLVKKTRAGADFIMTQLFYNGDAFLEFEGLLRTHESGAFTDIPLIPGLMPIQSWGILSRTTKLAGVNVPSGTIARIASEKDDDAKVKAIGVDVVSEIVMQIHQSRSMTPIEEKRGPQGYHFYTLNLEKAVARILERCNLVSASSAEDGGADSAITDLPQSALNDDAVHGHVLAPTKPSKDRRRLSSRNSAPDNRVVVSGLTSKPGARFEALDDEAGVPKEETPSKANALAISEGEGALGREATWDDYPNGRWGDARSPAYGSIDGYGPTLHVPPHQALELWGRPTEAKDIGRLFRRFLTGSLAAVPWSEESLSAETGLIREQLLSLNDKGWWTVASQPAVDAARSDDAIVGWGPRAGGWVWQKPFVELFLPSSDWQRLKQRLDCQTDEVTYFAGNAEGAFEASSEASINPVTWGAFKGKEIITPTQIDALSFRAWQDEAFALWREWQRLYPPSSPPSRLIQAIRSDVWLVNVIGHRFQDGGAGFWQSLLD